MLLRRSVLILAATIAWALAIPAAAQGAGRYVEVKYPPSAAPGELQVGLTYILWIPEGVTRLRGVIVHQHGAGNQTHERSAFPFLDGCDVAGKRAGSRHLCEPCRTG